MALSLLFEERQYLGHNKQSLLRRLIISICCFIAYYWSENPKSVNVSGIQIGSYPIQQVENSGQLFFLLGIAILIVSIVMMFIVHIHTIVNNEGVLLTGLWTSKKINIPFTDIASVHKKRYKRDWKGLPVFNLHKKKNVRFYTKGFDIIELVTTSGYTYKIGTQRSVELEQIIQQALTTLNKNKK